jgi:HSP20 family protein
MKASRSPAAGKRELAARVAEGHPLLSLRREMNRLFDGFFRGLDPFDSAPAWPMSVPGALAEGFVPRVNVVESDREVRVTAELPGMDEKDVEVLISRDALTLRGEKKAETEDRSGGRYRYERSYGAFHRTVPLPAGVTEKKAFAEFKKGVLTVRLPKSGEASTGARKIDVRSE